MSDDGYFSMVERKRAAQKGAEPDLAMAREVQRAEAEHRRHILAEATNLILPMLKRASQDFPSTLFVEQPQLWKIYCGSWKLLVRVEDTVLHIGKDVDHDEPGSRLTTYKVDMASNGFRDSKGLPVTPAGVFKRVVQALDEWTEEHKIGVRT